MIRFTQSHLVVAASVAAMACPAAAQVGAPHVRVSEVEPPRAGDPFTTLDLATLADFSPLAIAPDGRAAAVQTWRGDPASNSYRFTWHVVPLAGQAPVEVDGGDLVQRRTVEDARWGGAIMVEAPIWSADGAWFYYRKRIGDDLQVWRTRADGSTSERVTSAAGQIRAFAVGDGGTVIYAADPDPAVVLEERRQEGLRGYRFDDRFIPAFSHQPVIGRFRRDMMAGTEPGPEPLFVQTADGAERPATDTERRLFGTQTAWGFLTTRAVRRGDAEVSASVVDPERNRGPFAPTAVQLRRGRTTIVCGLAECRGYLAGLGLSGDGNVVYFVRREDVNGLARAIYVWDVRANRVRLVRRDPSLDLLSGCEFTDGAALCISEGPSIPRHVARVDLATGEATPLLDPNRSLAQRRHGPIRRLDIFNSWGQSAYAYLTLPPDYRPGTAYPLVVTTYRARGFQRGGIGDEYPVFPFAEQGFAVLAVDRADDWTALERNPDTMALERAEIAQMRERRATLETIELAVAELVRRGVADPARIAITGLSDGAETVNYAISHSRTFNVAISSGGGWEPSMAFLGPGNFARRLGIDVDHLRDDPYIVDQALTLRAGLVCAALLVNASESEFMTNLEPFHALRAARRPVEMFVYPGDYHIKWQPAHRLAIYNRNIDWLNFWFRGTPPAGEPAGTAAAWQSLRAEMPGSCR